MKRKARARFWLALLTTLGVAFAVMSLLYLRRDVPPVADLRDARIYLNLVQRTVREDEAAPILQSADENLVRAQTSLDASTGGVVPFRNYDLVRYHIKRARDLGSEAIQTGRQARLEAVADGQARLATLRLSLRTTRLLLSRMSSKDGALTRLTTAEAQIDVADARLSEQVTREVREILTQAEEELAQASLQIQGSLERFLSRRQQWNDWVQQTIAHSERENDVAVLIDKLNHECYVLQRGRVVDSFPVDLAECGWIRRSAKATARHRKGAMPSPASAVAVGSTRLRCSPTPTRPTGRASFGRNGKGAFPEMLISAD